MLQAYNYPTDFKPLFVSRFIYFILNFLKVIYNNLALISHQVGCCICSIYSEWLMLFRDIISADFEKWLRDVSTLCEKNGEYGLRC